LNDLEGHFSYCTIFQMHRLRNYRITQT